MKRVSLTGENNPNVHYSRDGQIKWYIHAMKYHAAIKNSEVLTHATTWVNLENMMLNKTSLSQKITYSMIPCTRNVQKR